METTLPMNGLPNKEHFAEAAAELAIAPAMVEKDWYMTQVLAFISNLSLSGHKIVFSGGTSLSKAQGLIKRFSEDIDFKVVTEEEAPDRAKRSKFKNSVIDILEGAGFAVDRTSLTARDNNRFFSFNVDYNSHFAPIAGFRPHIQLEFSVSRPKLPLTENAVVSFITQLKKDAPEVGKISCVDPVEIAADKLSALVWRIPKLIPGEKPEDRSLVRHMHDLAMLENSVKRNTQFPALVMAALQQDNERNKEISVLAPKEKFRLLLDTLTNKEEKYRVEYDTFVKSVSYATEGVVPNYDTAVNAVKRLIDFVIPS